MGRTSERDVARNRRKAHIRKKVRGDAERPRLCVFRSANHVYAQIIDDVRGHTLVAASTLSPELKEHTGHGGNVTAAREVGLDKTPRAQHNHQGQQRHCLQRAPRHVCIL